MVLPIALLIVIQLLTFEASEPVFYGDENRHVMTSIFFRDLLADRPLSGLRGYAENYYVQYPALGLLIWPPLFHALTGVVMWAVGTSSLVATLMVGVSAMIACVYLFRLTARTHDAATGSLAVLLFGLCPLVFEYSRHVMLEMPTLMWGLIATFHFVRYLDESRRRDVFIAAVASACAALTRFDAVYLLPLFGILLVVNRQWRVLKRWDVWGAAVVALLMVLPYYALVAREVGGLHLRQASESVRPGDSTFLALRNFVFYPAQLPSQVGWCVTIAAVVGLCCLSKRETRRRLWPSLAIVIATYATFSPLAELDSRHAIYWVPGIVVLAIEGVRGVAQAARLSRVAAGDAVAGGPPALRIAILLLAIATGSNTLAQERSAVHGYEAAARFVLEHSRDSKLCLFDGWLDGNFTYHVRHLDPQRRFSVLRGDKLFYGFVCFPDTNYTEYATTNREMLNVIDRHSPELLVLEEPPILQRIPAAERLRGLIHEHPERFRLEKTIPVRSGRLAGNYELRIYRNLTLSSATRQPVEFEVLGLGKTVRAASGNDE
ncbi:MAG: ArnT family glycosyltransferase [Planctomycetaceae bacterium]